MGDPVGRWYAGRVLWHRDAWHFLAWRFWDERGEFVGELSDPLPLAIGGDGELTVS